MKFYVSFGIFYKVKQILCWNKDALKCVQRAQANVAQLVGE